MYVASATGNLAAPASLTFKYSAGDYQVTKTFTFDDSYVLHADTEVLRNGAPIRALLSWPGGFGDQEDARSYSGAQVDYSQEQKEKHLAAGKVTGGNTLAGSFDWAGVSDLYFAAIFLPDAPDTATVATLDNQLMMPKADRHNGLGHGVPHTPRGDQAKDNVKVPILGAALGDLSGHTKTRIFAGPKAISVLKNIRANGSNATLEPLLDFGFFGIIGNVSLPRALLHPPVRDAELGLVHHHPHRADQPADPSAAHQDDAVCAEDAADSAADGHHQGALQEPEGDRSLSATR